jgi:hypothetical protein
LHKERKGKKKIVTGQDRNRETEADRWKNYFSAISLRLKAYTADNES